MKNVIFLSLIFISPMLSEAQPPVTLEFISPVKPVQDIFGLTLIEVEITNNTDSIVKIKESDRLYFESQIVGNDNWIPFRAGNAVFSTSHYQRLRPYESIRIITCLNLFDVFRQYSAPT